VLADPKILARRVACWLYALTTAKAGPFAIALSGGATPRSLYALLAEAPFVDELPWSRMHFFWGDERFVPPDDELSNFRMAREAMLSHATIPADNIHAMPTTGMTPEAAAAAYELELQSFYGSDALDPQRPLFDVVLLGLGPDGHTASLFPGAAALKERKHWVAAVTDVKTGANSAARLTLTYPALESARHTAFLVAGEEKRAILSRFRRGDASLPAARLHPSGMLNVFADAAAAGRPAKSDAMVTQHMIAVEHIRIDSTRTFAEVEARLERALPQIDPEIAEALALGDDVRARQLEGDAELFIFLKRDHGAMLLAAGKARKAAQYEIGNPRTATMMTRHRLPAALYAPLRVVLYESDAGGAMFEYDKPSTLFGQFDDEQVRAVASDLDVKLDRVLRHAAE
jgi:6-phosphogluconolactonase